jgi:hypothetical protein
VAATYPAKKTVGKVSASMDSVNPSILSRNGNNVTAVFRDKRGLSDSDIFILK